MNRTKLIEHYQKKLKHAPKGMTTDQSAEYLNCSVRTVRERCCSGVLPAVRLGPRYVVFKDWLIEYLVETAPFREFVI